MKLHANAPLGPKGRATMVRRVLEEGIALTEAAEGAGVSARTAGKWVRRYRSEGEAGLLDRSSAPRTVHNATPADRVEAIEKLADDGGVLASSGNLLSRAAEIAERHTISVYDAAYAAAAGDAGHRLISCDERDLVSKSLATLPANGHSA